jgi:sugar phosphate isomerase/epimerase
MCGPTQGIAAGDWHAALDYAGALGLDGVLFPTPRSASERLDAGELREVAAAAAERGLFVETGIGLLGPVDDAPAHRAQVRRVIDAAQALGCDQFFGYTTTVRDAGLIAHDVQVEQVTQTLESLRPLLADRGCRLNLKTHEDLSSVEVQRIIEDRLGTEHYGVALDTANLVVRGEDPVAATRRLAPYVHQTNLEDVALFFIESGLRRRLRPCGDGVLDWTEILTILGEHAPARHLVLEQHRGRFVAEVFRDGWFDGEPHLQARELARLVRATVECEAKARNGSGPSDEELGVEPDGAGRAEELRRSAAHLRLLLASVGGGSS